MTLIQKSYLCALAIVMMWGFSFSLAQGATQARTETNCNFGMAKGQKSGSCQVPIPSNCTVAKLPGAEQRWTDVSKGGATSCQFDEKKSDWKTSIVGTCGECTTDHCSARFSVMFGCSSTMTAPKMQRPAHK